MQVNNFRHILYLYAIWMDKEFWKLASHQWTQKINSAVSRYYSQLYLHLGNVGLVASSLMMKWSWESVNDVLWGLAYSLSGGQYAGKWLLSCLTPHGLKAAAAE